MTYTKLFSKRVSLALFTFLIFFSSSKIIAQHDVKHDVLHDTIKFSFKMGIEVIEGTAKDAMITVTKNGLPYKEFKYGKVPFRDNLDINSKYLFTCSKPGYITKKIDVDTNVPKLRELSGFAIFTAIVTLDLQPKDQDPVEYKLPVGFVYYMYKTNDFGYSKSQYEKVKSQKAHSKSKF